LKNIHLTFTKSPKIADLNPVDILHDTCACIHAHTHTPPHTFISANTILGKNW